MWRYLDLMNRTAPVLEDFYINLLDMFKLERSNPFTIFKSIHWQGFRNVILKDPTVKRIFKEFYEWRNSGLAMEGGNPGEYIDKIMYIRSNAV